MASIVAKRQCALLHINFLIEAFYLMVMLAWPIAKE
jgi:hypothetical protein